VGLGTKRSKTARHRKSSARSGMAGVSANLQITICFRSSGWCGCLRLLQNPVTNSRLSVGRCQVTLLFNDCAIGLRSPCIRQTMRCWNSREALGLPGQACCRPPQQQFSCWTSGPPPFPLFVASIPVGLPPVFLASLVPRSRACEGNGFPCYILSRPAKLRTLEQFASRSCDQVQLNASGHL
jgi:hypothetical protein